jgi:hypothetical protein
MRDGFGIGLRIRLLAPLVALMRTLITFFSPAPARRNLELLQPLSVRNYPDYLPRPPSHSLPRYSRGYYHHRDCLEHLETMEQHGVQPEG